MSTERTKTDALHEPTRWAETVADNVFQPGVTVQLDWSDIEAAVAQGAVSPRHAHALWASWAAPGSPTRVDFRAAQPEPSFPATLSDPPYLEKLRQLRNQPVPEPSPGVPVWLTYLVSGCIGAMLMFLVLAFF